MKLTTRAYVAIVCVIAALLMAAVIATSGAVDTATRNGVALLAVLAVVAEALGFLLPNAASGSIAYIPYLACVLIAPNWATLAAVVVVRIGTEALQHRPNEKRVFNVAQHIVTIALAIGCYKSLGGESLLGADEKSLSYITARFGIAAFVAFSVAMIANTLLVVGAISVSKDSRLLQVIRQVRLPTVGIDLLGTPVIFFFAWIYVAYGPVAAATLWVPILGLRQLNKANLELEQMNGELLQLMVKSIEARDPYTSGHSRRVQQYAVIIARGAKLSEGDVERISQAALLHDVGKINEKYHPILTKPDRLTPEEWAVMQEHPIDGANLVGTMTRLRHLLPAIRHHHENWDGTGYPDRIAGELIPLDARVIALADTIDAMSSARPYRPGLTPEQVRAEIVRCRGKQFDPTLADRVLSREVWGRLFPIAEEEEHIANVGLRLVRTQRAAI
jgi:putative nucleotidyltransferase with HDIG domain